MTSHFLKIPSFTVKQAIVASTLVLALAMMQDVIQYHFYNQSAFNFVESLLFEFFWVLFIPLSVVMILSVQVLLKKFSNGRFSIAIVATLFVSTVHFLSHAFIVFIFSYLKGEHVFQFTDVLQHSLAEDLYVCLLIYFAVCSAFLRSRITGSRPESPLEIDKPSLTRINVVHGTNNILIETSEIIFIAAASPYSCIHTSTGKFLYPQTLKSLEEKLDSAQFLRVHKSSIINMKRVVSYKSRLNGDYDLTLENGASVRMSRNYKAKFRALFT